MAPLPLAQITLQPELALSLVAALVTAVGAFYGTRYAATKAQDAAARAQQDSKEAAAETQRLLLALHGRFDGMEQRQHKLELAHARMEERMDALRQRHPTQRFKVEQDVFASPEDEQQ